VASRDAALYEWIKREEAAGNIYQEVDGMWVWAPKGGGFLNEYALNAMAEYLTARNAFWTWQINHDPAIGGSEEIS
jgi:hypothetical protein